MVRIIRSPSRLYRSPDIKSSKKKRSRVFDVIPILDDEKKQSEPTILDQRWEMKFLELKKLKEKYGHCDVPLIGKRYKYLALWSQKQRGLIRYSPKKFDPDRLRKLNEIGFDWSPRDEHWEKYYSMLKAHKRKHGHCDVIIGKEYTGLRLWCIRQRILKKRNSPTMSAQRVNKLNVIGFRWDPIDERWEKGFMEWKKYKKKYGHCDVVRKKPWLQVYSWVQVQRKNYKEGKALTDEKIKRLNAEEFLWEGSIKPLHSEEEILNDLRRLFKMLKRTPTSVDVDKHGKYSRATYSYRFGGMREARKKAGMGNGNVKKRPIFTDEELLQELKRLYRTLKKIPMYTDIEEYGKYSPKLYEIRFGGLREARQKAGLNSYFIRKPNIYSDAELLNDLKRLASLLDKIPNSVDVQKHGKYSVNTYYRLLKTPSNSAIQKTTKK
jgi:Homing endonuclease associated repeat/Helicase associated domain